MQHHFKAVKVHPLAGFRFADIIVEISRCISERMKLAIGGQQNGSRDFLVEYAWLSTLMTSHEMYHLYKDNANSPG